MEFTLVAISPIFFAALLFSGLIFLHALRRRRSLGLTEDLVRLLDRFYWLRWINDKLQSWADPHHPFFHSEQEPDRPQNTVTIETVYVVLSSAIINLVFAMFVNEYICGIDLRTCLAIPGLVQVEPAVVEAAIYPHTARIVSYFLGLYLFSFFLGHGLRVVVRASGVSQRLGWFEYSSQWHHILLGQEEWDSVPEDEISDDIEWRFYALVSVAVTIGGVGYLYEGVLDTYCLNRDGTIRRLTLNSTSRYQLGPTGTRQLPFNIEGVRIMIPGSKIENLNVHHFAVGRGPDPPDVSGQMELPFPANWDY